MKTLDPFTLPLESINLIEASAGTGKSWTVSYLYLRLLLEKSLTVDQILVVTFTDAATKELRNDIRQRIMTALTAFEAAESAAGYTEKDEYSQLINLSSERLDKHTAIRQLKRAKLSMDESAIFTIHGFCQRSLSENAFEAALPFDSKLLENESELMQQVTDDFWRRYTKNAPQSLLFKLQQKSITPDTLLKDIKNAVDKPYLKICGPDSYKTDSYKTGSYKTDSGEDDNYETEKWEDLAQGFQDVFKQWKVVASAVTQILLTNKNLNGNKFRKTTVVRLCNEMNQINSLYDLDADFMASAKKLKQSYIEQGTKARCHPPEHAFFAVWEVFSDLWEQLNKDSDDFLNNIRIKLIDYLQRQLPHEKQRLGVLSFSDLLLQLQQALASQESLAKNLRSKYQAALIDEFQDTDPIQYDIFRKIYNDSNSKSNAVFFVGDPKQAIYSFRGGDIYSYLKAKADTHTQNTLKTNWRSHADLITAFNALYAIADNPFKDQGIEYVEVNAGDKTTDKVISSQHYASLNFWQYNFAGEKKSAATIRQTIATSMAGDIAQFLNDGLQGKASIGEKAISGGDIAVLVRSHGQANIIKAALNARGIPSVQNSRDSIYETHEAHELIYLLKAILSPQQENEVRRALVTEFMGYQGKDLIAFQEHSNAWEDILLAMQNWHQQWNKQGFLAMMRSVMKVGNTHRRLLSFADGERRISNILQLSELLHQAARNNMLGMTETLRWLQKQQRNASSKETELRLESDEDLVKIVTIHKSKGLEYPIVYCPYIGMSGKAISNKIFTFHKEGDACLEIGSQNYDEHQELSTMEESAENTRLLYVALTRAKYQCHVVCFTEAISGIPDYSALGYLLSNGKTVKQHKSEFFTSYQQNLQRLAASKASIALLPLPEYPTTLNYQNNNIQEKWTAREFNARIKSQAQVTSFSGLTAGAHDEKPDYDSFAELISPSQDKSKLVPDDNTFPRGAIAGTALHEIFEHVDFVKPVSEQLDIVNITLDKYGFDKKYQPSALQLIQQTLDAPLLGVDHTEFSLKQLSKAQRLDEMEFYLPLERLCIDDLRQILYRHLPQDLPQDLSQKKPHWQTIRNAVGALYFDEVEGFLKGYIDLIFEYKGQYYLADYKSNSLIDYGETALFDVMAHSHYYLQYLFYSVALHRYLKQRITDYSWDRHIGGAYYLFIRGMLENEETPKKRGGVLSTSSVALSNAVFYDKPSLHLIEALDKLFVSLELTC